MKKWLTDQQKALLFDLDEYINALPPNHGINHIPLDAKKFKNFKLIAEKLQKFPDHNASIPLFGHRYRGFEIYEHGKPRPRYSKKAQEDMFHESV